MFFQQKVLVLTAALTMDAVGFAQTPPIQPTAPAAPRAPRVLRGGRSIGTHSTAKRGYLGVGVAEVTAERAKALKLPTESGVEVKRVDENSPAAKAGLKENDIILEVNGKTADDVEAFVSTIGDSAPGAKVELAVWRNGAKQNLTAMLGSRRVMMALPTSPFEGTLINPRAPEDVWPPGMVSDAPRVGFEGEMLTPQLAEFFGVKEGVLVRTVNAKSAAEKAGLKAGDVVMKVNGTPVSNPREVSALLRATRKNATFTVMRNHKEITLNVEVADDRGPSPDRLVL